MKIKIKISEVERAKHDTLEDCIKAKGIVSNFKVVGGSRNPIDASMIIEIEEA